MGSFFFEELGTELSSAILAEISRDNDEQVDPFAAAGIAFGAKGQLSDEDIVMLGMAIGIRDGFD